MSIPTTIFAMLISNDVWTVYGINVPPALGCTIFNSESARVVGTGNVTRKLVQSTFEPVAHFTLQSLHSTDVVQSISTMISGSPLAAPFAASPSAPAAKSAGGLRTGVKIGIGFAVGVLGCAVLLLVLEACYLRRKRQETALQRAVEEVESGISKGSEERIVLESRVSIVFDDEGEVEELEEEEDRGRNGLSLQRRE